MEQPFSIHFTVGGKQYSGGYLVDTEDLHMAVRYMHSFCDIAIDNYCKRRWGRNSDGKKVVRVVECGNEFWDIVED